MFVSQQKSQAKPGLEEMKSINANSLYPAPTPRLLQHLEGFIAHPHDEKSVTRTRREFLFMSFN